jgi:cytochrome b561
MSAAIRTAYTRTAIVLHWLIAAAVLAQVSLGLWMIGIPKSPPGVRAWWFNVHKSIGITIGLLVIIRLLWRLTHTPPPLPGSMRRWQRLGARISHYGLYTCLILLPLSGYLGSSFTKYPILFYGYRLPHWGWDSPVLKELCSQVHFYAACVLIALVLLHVSAALKHLLVDKDGVFQRMFPLFTPHIRQSTGDERDGTHRVPG